MNPQLTIPMGPTGGAPIQYVNVTPVGTGYVAPVQDTGALLWIAMGLYVLYLYKHRRHRA